MSAPLRWRGACLLLCLCLDAAAQDRSGNDNRGGNATEHFAAGTAAFAEQDYERALARFAAAVEAGDDTAAVRYNLAVSQYRLGLYADAERGFRALGRRFPEMRPLAEYNRGLALTRLGRTEEARAAFANALLDGDEGLAALATAMLDRLPAASAAPSREPWTRVVDLRLGHDDNVVLIDASSLPADVSPDSAFAEVLAYAGGPIGEHGPWRLDVSGYLVDYRDAEDFEQANFYLGARYHWRGARSGVLAGPQISVTTLAGDVYEQTLGAGIEWRRTLGAGHASFATALTRDEIEDAEPRFSYVRGQRTRLRLLFDTGLGGGRFLLDAGLERDDRAGVNVSADRQRYLVRYRRAFGASWSGELSHEYRVSDYDEAGTPRTETRHRIGVELARPLGSQWRLNVALQQSDNDSTDLRYAYDRLRAGIGVSRTF